MKRTISIILSVCIAFSMVAAGIVTSYAESSTIDDTQITWDYDDTTKTLTFDGTGDIPSYNTYSDENGQLALAYPWKDLAYTSIVFGEGITGIGNYAFCYSEALETVVIPDTVVTLGDGIFLSCTSLKEVTMPSDVTVVSTKLFSNCLSLESITLSEKTESIANMAFYKCSSLTTISLPSILTSIGDSAFSQCTSLATVDIPDTVKAIGQSAFYCCEELGKISVPSATIGANAFDGCSAMTEISFAQGVTEIPEAVCSGCSSLTSVSVPYSVTSIDNEAFNLCTSLKEITLSSRVISIGEKAIGYGKRGNLVEGFIIYGYNDTQAQKYTDDNKISFVALDIIDEDKYGENITGSYYSANSTLKLSGTGDMYDYTPDTLPKYSAYDFKILEIEDSITSIGNCAFLNSTVSQFDIPKSVEKIGEHAFGYTSKEVTNEETQETSYEYTPIDGFVIRGYKGTAAETYATDNRFIFEALDIPSNGTCGENLTWEYDAETKTLTISGTGDMYDYTIDSLPAYCGLEIDSIVAEDGVTSVGNLAFLNIAEEEIDIPASVTSIGENAIGYVRHDLTDEHGNTVPSEYIKDTTGVIKGYKLTSAEDYAKANEIEFVAYDLFTLEKDAPLVVDDENIIYLFASDTNIEDVLNKYISFNTAYTVETANLIAPPTPAEPEEDNTDETPSTDEDDTEDETPVSKGTVATGTTITLSSGDKTVVFTFVVCGDVNSSGNYNSTDALLMLQYIVGEKELTDIQKKCADMNYDREINSSDALLNLRLTTEDITLKDCMDSFPADNH